MGTVLITSVLADYSSLVESFLEDVNIPFVQNEDEMLILYGNYKLYTGGF